jgi:hypothetical protein
MRWLVVFLYVDEDGDDAGLFIAIAGEGTPLEAVRHVIKNGDAPEGWHFSQATPWPEGANDSRDAAIAWHETVGWA